MPTANVVTTYARDGHVYLEIQVDEGGRDAGNRVIHQVYTGKVPMDAAWTAMTPTQQRAALVAACKALRDERIAVPPTTPAMSGTVAI